MSDLTPLIKKIRTFLAQDQKTVQLNEQPKQTQYVKATKVEPKSPIKPTVQASKPQMVKQPVQQPVQLTESQKIQNEIIRLSNEVTAIDKKYFSGIELKLSNALNQLNSKKQSLKLSTDSAIKNNNSERIYLNKIQLRDDIITYEETVKDIERERYNIIKQHGLSDDFTKKRQLLKTIEKLKNQYKIAKTDEDIAPRLEVAKKNKEKLDYLISIIKK